MAMLEPPDCVQTAVLAAAATFCKRLEHLAVSCIDNKAPDSVSLPNPGLRSRGALLEDGHVLHSAALSPQPSVLIGRVGGWGDARQFCCNKNE